MALTTSTTNGAYPLTSRGKVRDLYKIDQNTLLFVATDRVSAFDVTLANGIPSKGRLLNQLTAHWLSLLTSSIPDLQTHFITLDLPSRIPASLRPVFDGRSMQVRKLKVLPIEAIVRGYLTGGAWIEYQTHGTVHEISMPKGIQQCEQLPEPLFTPSTKAPPGEKDLNIHPSAVAGIVGSAAHAARIEELSLKLYKTAQAYAAERGVIIADTKFEFGLDEENDEVVLIDEVLTPDSSRFWEKSEHTVGKPQKSLDKQVLRDWLTEQGLKGKEGVEMSEEVVERTWARYKEVYKRLVGKEWVEG